MAADYTITVRSDGTRITAENEQGGTMEIGQSRDQLFNPVEMLLAALGGCAAIDFGTTTRKRRHDVGAFDIEVRGEKADDVRLQSITVVYRLAPGIAADDPEVQTAVRLTRDVLCTVSRTLTHGAAVEHVVVESGAGTA